MLKLKQDWTTIVVAGIVFHLDHDRQMAIPFEPLPQKTKYGSSLNKSSKSIGKASINRLKQSP
jgi:hypothetical protein